MHILSEIQACFRNIVLPYKNDIYDSRFVLVKYFKDGEQSYEAGHAREGIF